VRIHITGNAGSGKTTLAEHIGQALDLPVFGLDAIVWSPGWRKTPSEVRDVQEAELVAQPQWVIEGVSGLVREAADVVIVLDVDRLTSLVRCAKRNWKYLFRSRPGLPARCPELLIVPRLCRIIWRFPERVLPTILADAHSGQAQYFRVRNAVEQRAALLTLGIAKESL